MIWWYIFKWKLGLQNKIEYKHASNFVGNVCMSEKYIHQAVKSD